MKLYYVIIREMDNNYDVKLERENILALYKSVDSAKEAATIYAKCVYGAKEVDSTSHKEAVFFISDLRKTYVAMIKEAMLCEGA